MILLHVIIMPLNGGKNKKSKYQVELWLFIMTNAQEIFVYCSPPLFTSSLVQEKCACVHNISHIPSSFPVDVHPKISPESAYN